MKTPREFFAPFVVASAAVLLIAGCGDPELLDSHHVNAERSTAELAVVTPEFQITGLPDIPQELSLEELGLSITEIRLEPLRGERGVAYSTSRPIHLAFDIASGETSLRGDTVEFPETGRFLVSLRLEPTETGLDPAGNGERGSLEMSGMVRNDFLINSDEGDTTKYGDDGEDRGVDRDGNPLPLPVTPYSDEEPAGMWSAFSFSSRRAVFYTFSDIELVAGEQTLTFSFDLNDWATTAIAPIVNAVEREGREGSTDISGALDSPTAVGPEALLQSGTVATVVQ